MRVLAASDRLAGGVAKAAATLAQMALVALGVHLAADTVDDRVLELLLGCQSWADAHLTGAHVAVAEKLGMAWDTLVWWPSVPVAPISAGLALVLELAADALLVATFLLTPRGASLEWSRYKRALSVRAIVTPIALAGVLVAGAWSLAMAAEDLLPHSPVAPWAAGLLGLAALVRMGAPAWSRAVAALDPPKRWTDGLAPALVMLPVGLLAWAHGAPIWGWLP
jgi:hypothetical protein